MTARRRAQPSAPATEPAVDASEPAGVVTGADTTKDHLAAILERVKGQGARLELWRVYAGEPQYLATMDADSFSLEMVRAEHGGGKFQARVRGVAGHYIGGSARFSIAGAPIWPAAPAAPAGPAAAAEFTRASDPVVALAANLERMLERMEARLAAIENRKPEPTPALGGFAEMMKASADTFGAMLKMMQPAAPAPAPATDAMTVLELVREGMKIGRSMRGGDSGGEGLAVLAGAFPKLLELAEKSQNQQPQPAPAQLPPPRQESEPVNPMALLKPFMPKLLQCARENRNVDTYAGVLEDEHPAATAFLRRRVQLTGDPDAILEEFFIAFPEAREDAEWFGALLMEICAPEEEEEEISGVEGP